MFNKIRRHFREPVNALTHLSGVFLSVVALIAMIRHSLEAGSVTMLAAFTIFGLSLILMYISSTLYHTVYQTEWIQKMRTFDHMMIYFLIAGTFTPLALVGIGGNQGTILTIAMWLVAAAGIFSRLFIRGTPGWITIGLYLTMGWAGLSVFPYLIDVLHINGLIWLGIGAICYTTGAIIYGTGKPDPLPQKLGYHGIWHLLVLGGTFSHFWAIYRYVGMI